MKKHFILTLLVIIFLCSPQNTLANTEKEVVMDGVGTSENAAQEQAFRNAIRSVVGSMVLSEVVVENDAILRDKVLSHSNGYITKSKQIGETRVLDGGLVEVTMQVTVKTQELTQKLKDEKISVTSVDGQSLFAQIKTKEEAKQNITEILTEKLKSFPVGFAQATASMENMKAEKLNNGLTRVTIQLNMRADMDAYKTFVKDLSDTLDSFKIPSASKMTKGRTFNPEERNNPFPNFKKSICILESYDVNTEMSRWKIYDVNPELYEFFKKQDEKYVQIVIQLLNKENKLVSENFTTTNSDWKISDGNLSSWPNIYMHESYYDNRIFLTHFEEVADGGNRVTFVTMPVFQDLTFDLSDEQLKSITSAKCVLSIAE